MLRIQTLCFTPTLLVCVTIAGPALAQTANDTVRWDDRAGQWVYTLFNPANPSKSKEVRYTPRTLIEPRVKSKVQWDKDLYQYSYRIKNGAGARQPVSEVTIHAPRWDAEAIKHAASQPGMSWAQIQTKARAEMAAEEAFVAKTVYAPIRWKPFLNLNNPTQVVFGWLTDYQKSYSGIAPGTAQDSFSVLRAELPGAGWMELQGYAPDMYNAATLPRAGAVAEQVEQVLRNDSADVTVLVPAIIVPKPYNGAELARRFKAHVATWPDAGLINAETFLAVNSKLDGLITALQANDKKAAKAAEQSLLAEARKHHAGMGDSNTEDDDDTHDSKAYKRIVISTRGTLEEIAEPLAPIHRVAVRALAFNLKYVMDRM